MKLRPFPTYTWLLLFVTVLVAACAPQTASDESAETAVETADQVVSESTAAETVREPAETDSASSPAIDPSRYDDYEIVTLLPPDAIPAIDNPQFLTAAEVGDEYEPDELVLGVFINGEARAYSVPHLSSHEIVNDTVGGRKISVTW